MHGIDYEGITLPITTPSLRVILLHVPRVMTEEEFNWLAARIDSFKNSLVAKPEATDAK